MKTITDQAELERRLIYSVLVAGKTAAFAEQKTEAFLSGMRRTETPLQYVLRLDDAYHLGLRCAGARTGNYAKTERAFRDIAHLVVSDGLDLRTCPPESLERAHGVGPKTSRFFVLWTRPDARYSALDRHVLAWLREIGHPDVPRQTPGSWNIYAYWELIFLREADLRGVTPRELDHAVWAAGAGGDGPGIPGRLAYASEDP